MQRLAAKGYIEIYRVRAARWLADRGKGPEPAERRDGGSYIDGVVARTIYAHFCCRRNRVLYRLTAEGRDTAYAISERRRAELTRAREGVDAQAG